MITMVRETLGRLLKRLISENHTSQRRLAKDSGIDLSYINRLANDKAGGIGRNVARTLAPFLNVKASVLMEASIGEEIDPEEFEKPSVEERLSSVKDTIVEIEEELKRTYNKRSGKEVELIGGVLPLPVRGFIRAGMMGVTEQEEGEVLIIARAIVEALTADPSDVYVLRVIGESLQGDGIHSGDHILVKPTNVLDADGKIYVIRDPSTGESVLRHLSRKNGELLVTSSNPDYPPLVLKQVEIIGRVIYRNPSGSAL